MVIEDFSGTLAHRMEKLNALLRDKGPMIMVGSSYGGLMAAIYALENPGRIKKAMLLSPALAHGEIDSYLGRSTETPVTIYHGEKDDVVPLEAVCKKAHQVFTNLTFNKVDDDHVLSKTFTSIDWDGFLTG